MKRFNRAFTLVELMMVITIIAILAGVLMSVSLGAIRSARSRRTAAMKMMLSTAISTYYAQEGKWPGQLETLAKEGRSEVLKDDAAQAVFQEIVKISTGKSGTVNPLIDPTGLFVARKGIKDGKGYGLPYSEARRGDKDGKRAGGVQMRQAIGVEQMAFGFQGKMTGKFRRFRLIYHAQADSVEVSKCCEHCIQCEGGEITCKAPYFLGGKVNPDACPHCHKVEKED